MEYKEIQDKEKELEDLKHKWYEQTARTRDGVKIESKKHYIYYHYDSYDPSMHYMNESIQKIYTFDPAFYSNKLSLYVDCFETWHDYEYKHLFSSMEAFYKHFQEIEEIEIRKHEQGIKSAKLRLALIKKKL